MTDQVFLNYTQDELDRNFDQRAWVDDADQLLARHAQLSEQTRQRLHHLPDIAYGTQVDEVLDYFPSSRAGAPLVVFIHGGAWRHLTKADYSFVANAQRSAGIATVIPEFSKLPGATLPQLTAQIRRALHWTRLNAARLGADSDNIHLLGHSSGAHLAMAALTADGSEGTAFVRSITCISGIYDLGPVMLSARRHYIDLSADQVRQLSPQHQVHHVPCPAAIFFASRDSDEFQRQAREFSAGLRAAGRLTRMERFDANHYDVVDMLDNPQSPLSQALLQAMGMTAPGRDFIIQS